MALNIFYESIVEFELSIIEFLVGRLKLFSTLFDMVNSYHIFLYNRRNGVCTIAGVWGNGLKIHSSIKTWHDEYDLRWQIIRNKNSD